MACTCKKHTLLSNPFIGYFSIGGNIYESSGGVLFVGSVGDPC